MRYRVFRDFVTAQGRNQIREWLDGLPPGVKAEINVQIRMLEVTDRLGMPHTRMLRGDCAGLMEIRIKARKVQYRPLAWFGPQRGEVTLLLGAEERGSTLVPPNACHTALERRDLIATGRATTREHDFG